MDEVELGALARERWAFAPHRFDGHRAHARADVAETFTSTDLVFVCVFDVVRPGRARGLALAARSPRPSCSERVLAERAVPLEAWGGSLARSPAGAQRRSCALARSRDGRFPGVRGAVRLCVDRVGSSRTCE